MGLITDATIDSGALRRRLQSSTTGLSYWDESVGRRQFAWDTVNSRWQLVYGDTGWRDITALFTPDAAHTALTVYMRRVNATVTIAALVTSNTDISKVSTATVATGFKPQFQTAISPVVTSSAVVQGALYVNTGGLVGVRTILTQTNGGSHLVYTTTDAWPATLPGTASGSIPNS